MIPQKRETRVETMQLALPICVPRGSFLSTRGVREELEWLPGIDRLQRTKLSDLRSNFGRERVPIVSGLSWSLFHSHGDGGKVPGLGLQRLHDALAYILRQPLGSDVVHRQDEHVRRREDITPVPEMDRPLLPGLLNLETRAFERQKEAMIERIANFADNLLYFHEIKN